MAKARPRGKMAHMKKLIFNILLVGGAMAFMGATWVSAGDALDNPFNASTHENVADNSDDLYRGNELSVDAFGTGSIGKYTIEHISNNRVRHNGRLGVGAGINYFFTEYFGIGADAYSENTTGAFIDDASGNFILRIPLGETGLAPYAYAGGGEQFDRTHLTFAQAGAGLEFRFTPHVGVLRMPALSCRMKPNTSESGALVCVLHFNGHFAFCAGGPTAGAIFFTGRVDGWGGPRMG